MEEKLPGGVLTQDRGHDGSVIVTRPDDVSSQLARAGQGKTEFCQQVLTLTKR